MHTHACCYEYVLEKMTGQAGMQEAPLEEGGREVQEQERNGYQGHWPELEIKGQFCSDVENLPTLNTICYCWKVHTW